MAAGPDVPRKRSNSLTFLPPDMSELRVVILGSGRSQRSSVGNLLLNEAVFDATKEPESPMRLTGELQDKKISVIHCPDLLQPDLTADALSELVTDITDACAPGPHVFLLVLSPEDFTEQQNIRLQSVLRSFSEQSFHHSLVLLTATKETSVMEDYVNSPPLKDLIRKCKNRYQWVKGFESHMISEIHKELLTKIVQILKENDEKPVIKDATSAAHHDTKERKGSILTALRTGFHKKATLYSDSALRIVLFGKSDDKKSKMCSMLNDSSDLPTKQNFFAAKIWKKRPVVVKTPNLFSLPIETVREELKKCVSHCSPGPNVLLLLVKPSDFSVNDRKTLTFILSLFGPEAFKHSMVVLTHDDQIIPSVSKLICDCGGTFYNMFDENHKLLTDSLKSIVDQNKSSFLTLTEEQKPSLNLVLFGGSRAEKTSAAESILGRADLPARIPGQCVKHEAEVCDYWVSLVELPPLSDKPLETVMQQCLHCISLCAPEGVHVFILVLPLGPLTDEDKAELKTIQDTLSSRVRLFTMILFIHSDPSAPAVLQFVKGDRDIQRLCQSCGGGRFIFNPRDQQQVPELLKYLHRLKIINKTYTTETLVLAQTKKISAQHKEIEDMKSKMNTYGDLHPDCLKIVLIGKTGNGKSSSGNTILGRKEFSAMASQKSVTKVCKRVETTVDGRSVAVVDTPGLFDTTMSHDEVFEEMLRCISLLAPGPHVFLLVLQIGRLTEEEKQTLKLIKEAFGEEAQKFTIILFTHGDKLINDEISIEDYIENECESYFKELISKCGNRFHVFNNTDKENHTQVLELLQKIDEMVKENGGNCFTNDMLQEAEAAIKKEMKRIMKEKEEEMRKEREEMERKYQQEMEEIKQNMDKQREEFEKERKQRDKELREKEERIKEEKEQQKREQEKREEEEKLQHEKWEEKRKTLEEKIRLEQKSKEANRRQLEAERDQWERERKEWWEKRKQEDEERRQQEKKLKEEIKQIENEKEQKEKELKEKERKIKDEQNEREREQKKREEQDRKKKEEEEKQHQQWNEKHKELEEKIKYEELSKEMSEIKLKESRRQMEQEREQWKRERKERWEKRKQEDEERRQLEERRQEEMRQIKMEKEQKEKELKEKEEEHKREQENREKEDIKRKEEEKQQRLQWEQKHKELEEKIQSEAKSKETQLEENRRQMEQEREQWERERKEWWEKRKQEEEERKQEEEKQQKEMEQERKNYNKRLREDELKLELEEKKRKELEEKYQKQEEEMRRNYEDEARRQAEENNEFKEKYRKDTEYMKQLHKEQIEEKNKSYDLLQALTAHNERQNMVKHQEEISALVEELWKQPDKLGKMNLLMSKHEKEINELVTKHEEELSKATNEEEKKTTQKEQEEARKTMQKQHEKEISELLNEVNKSIMERIKSACVIS